MHKITYKFEGSPDAYVNQDALPVDGSLATIKVELMKQALASKTIMMPKGLSREEARAFILAHATGEK